MSRLLAIILVVVAGAFTSARAQNFMQHIRKTEAGKGTVTVTQSEEIDKLVNGNAQSTPADIKQQNKNTPTLSDNNRKPANTLQNGHKTETTHGVTTRKEAEHTPSTSTTNDNEEDIPVVDMRKKVMRSGYKITGYRVQAYAGGNTRKDRLEAERIRNAIKIKFPDQPVYVHFYSPRWICRVGNYRSYEEAAWMLGQLHKMGYKSATVVKGKITVQY